MFDDNNKNSNSPNGSDMTCNNHNHNNIISFQNIECRSLRSIRKILDGVLN